MYTVKVLESSGTEIANLTTSSRTIARDFVYDSITESWNGTDCRVGLYDPEYGFYAMAIPHTENSVSEAFEIMSLDRDLDCYYCIPDAIDIMQDLLC